MVRSTDRPAMTIAVDLGRKATKQTKYSTYVFLTNFRTKYLMLCKFYTDVGGINSYTMCDHLYVS